MGDGADYQALREDVGAVWLERDFVAVDGPDAVSFLQGQLSQDVNVEVGASAWAMVLQPQGKLDAFVRLWRQGEDRFVLDTDGGWGPAVVERLNRFKLRVKAEVGPLAWKCLALRGPRAHEVAGAAASPGTVVLGADWPGLAGADLVGEGPELPAGVRLCGPAAYQVARIEAGVPEMGREIDESTIPAEAGIVERSVSWTKGCYTGQELVARIDSRGGNVPRRLRGLVLGEGEVPPAGARVVAGEKDVGRVTSVGEPIEGRAPVALAYVGRAVEPPADVTVTWDGGSVLATVEPLPLVP
ncbi:MAG: glycine cleavage T C-terminal barrel domain-containing protein [Actinomycetota bacterium]